MKFILIVPAAAKLQAEEFAHSIDPLSEGDSFTTPLRRVGENEITHYANLPNITDEPVIAAIRQLVNSDLFGQVGGIYAECEYLNARAEFQRLLSENGLEEIPPPSE